MCFKVPRQLPTANSIILIICKSWFQYDILNQLINPDLTNHIHIFISIPNLTDHLILINIMTNPDLSGL